MAGEKYWISTEDRLPEECESVLVFQPKRKAKQKVFQAFLSKGFHGDKKEHWLSHNAFSGGFSTMYTVDDITHWTNLPAPPIDGEKSNWIPFLENDKEKLEWIGEVLIFVPKCPFSHNLERPVVTTSFWREGDWYGCYSLEYVTHWMPLPEPPKEVTANE